MCRARSDEVQLPTISKQRNHRLDAKHRKRPRQKSIKVRKEKLSHSSDNALYNDKKNSIADICKSLRVSRSTLYRYITASR
jgi:predicted transcriptional regulator YheO